MCFMYSWPLNKDLLVRDMKSLGQIGIFINVGFWEAREIEELGKNI
jgi:hypothetical protein